MERVVLVEVYEILGRRIALWKIGDAYSITNGFTQKGFTGLGFADASDIFDICIAKVKEDRGWASLPN